MGYFFVTLVAKIPTYVEYAAVLPPAIVIPSHSQSFSAILSHSPPAYHNKKACRSTPFHKLFFAPQRWQVGESATLKYHLQAELHMPS